MLLLFADRVGAAEVTMVGCSRASPLSIMTSLAAWDLIGWLTAIVDWPWPGIGQSPPPVSSRRTLFHSSGSSSTSSRQRLRPAMGSMFDETSCESSTSCWWTWLLLWDIPLSLGCWWNPFCMRRWLTLWPPNPFWYSWGWWVLSPWGGSAWPFIASSVSISDSRPLLWGICWESIELGRRPPLIPWKVTGKKFVILTYL